MKHDLPSGSSIVVTTDGADTLIAIPHASGGVGRYFRGLFMLFWLGGWAWGWSMAFKMLTSGAAKGGPSAFILFWLGAWTVGGVAVMYSLYHSFRPSVPELLRLTSNGVLYDSGVAPSQGFSGEDGKRTWGSMFPKRTRVELDRRKLQSLRLRETGEGNRLTIDADALRIEIGRSASEVEREWLHQALVKRYALRPPTSPATAP